MNTIPLPKRLILATLALLAVSLGSFRLHAHADGTARQLIISQFKITASNGQFFTLYNSTNDTLDMSKYQLEYFNNFDVSKSTSSKFIGLSGMLAPHSYYMVSDTTSVICYQETVNSVSLGLSSTSGMVEVLSFTQATPGGSVIPALQDYVGWSKSAVSGAQTLPTNTAAFLQRLPVSGSNAPQISAPGMGTWQAVQPSLTDACKLTTVAGSSVSTSAPIDTSQLQLGTQPASTTITLLSDTSSDSAETTVSNSGLVAPVITEILPNPKGAATDSSDEFIELYNGNNTSFDLSGFSLRSGTITQHIVSFPAGALLPANSFTAFFASTINASLSNSGGQVALLDRSGAVVSQTDMYGTAKDGEVWAFGSGAWHWSTAITPGAANIIIQPPVLVKSQSKLSTTGKHKVSVKTPGTSKAPKSALSVATKPAGSLTAKDVRRPIHSGVLALIATGAILYGIYEYRADLGNRIFQLKTYVATRRAHRV
jgi:hypothetical protein